MSSFVVRARVACWLRPVTTAWAEAVPFAGCARIDPPSALVVVQLLEDAEVTGTFVPVQGGPTAPALVLPLSVKATNPRVLVKEARSAKLHTVLRVLLQINNQVLGPADPSPTSTPRFGCRKRRFSDATRLVPPASARNRVERCYGWDVAW